MSMVLPFLMTQGWFCHRHLKLSDVLQARSLTHCQSTLSSPVITPQTEKVFLNIIWLKIHLTALEHSILCCNAMPKSWHYEVRHASFTSVFFLCPQDLKPI
jgi:hypothetical protein